MDAWGVEATYLDADDVEHRISRESIERLRALVGRAPEELESVAPLVLRPADASRLRGVVQLESGDTLELDRSGQQVPLGYHTLVEPDGSQRTLIVSPGRCVLPDARAWGWAVQLYAARSRASGGIGDLHDLATLARWAGDGGAGFVLVNPVHAVALAEPQQTSPYFPSSRRFRNPLYLRLEDIPGADRVDVSAAVAAGRDLNATRDIDRDAVWRIKRPALEALFVTTATDTQFLAWRATQGAALESFATWSALADEFGARWTDWPAGLRRPDTQQVEDYRAREQSRITFQAWLQWQLSMQFDRAARELTIIQDLPIGFDPHGADAWAWQDLLCFDATVGAPPDKLATAGQDWGLPPFVPWRLRQAGYRPFVESVRATMTAGSAAGGLRIDHVMGLFRLWWIPRGDCATEGGYVRYPADDLMHIVALESARAGAVVIGEDLGTVEAGVREKMRAANMLSYRLLYFEDESAPNWPEQAMAAVTTHDLPTVAGLWSRSDLADQQAAGVAVDADSLERLRMKVADEADLPTDATERQAVEAAYGALAQAPCRLLTATLDDALVEPTRPNIPGTEAPTNWSRALPAPIEELGSAPAAAAIATALGRATGRPSTT